VLRRARKSWHLLRRRLGAGTVVAHRLAVEKVKWRDDARSPVMLGIDDLTNAWHSHAGAAGWDSGGDWGGGLAGPGSALAFLEARLLKDFPEARVTFFTVAGPISAYTHHQPFSHAAPIDADDESRQFFRSLSQDPRFELAYHGLNHGTAGVRTPDFVQEWRGFPSVAAAVAQTRSGLAIFARATGAVPKGGKYGGYDYNEWAEDALNEIGFLWWCRDWMPRDADGRVADPYYEPQLFGRNLVVALPSTIHGHFWDRRQIDRLLAHGQIISIAEHIAPVRPDGLVQTPNIVDDIDELRRLYAHLRGKNVWHATGTEIASYVIAREISLIHDVTRDGFSIRYDGPVDRPHLTLRVHSGVVCTPALPAIAVQMPDGTPLDPALCRFDRERYRHLITIPVTTGRYRVTPAAESTSSRRGQPEAS
jgi:hypothetical protein